MVSKSTRIPTTQAPGRCEENHPKATICHRSFFRSTLAITLVGLLGCSDNNPPQSVQDSSNMDVSTDDERATDSDTNESTSPDTIDTSEDTSDNNTSMECAQGFASYQVPQNDHAVTRYGCKKPYEVNKDEVDVFLPLHAGTFPVLIVIQGAKVEKSYYSRFAEYVSSYGVIVAIPNHSSALGKYFTEQKVFNNVWAFLQNENALNDSALFEKVDIESVSVIGHSFGGTAAMNLAQNKCEFPSCSGNLKTPKELKAALFYGFNNLNPITGGATPILNIAPMLLIAGELNDAKKTEKTYNSVKKVPKLYTLVKGANHYGIANENNPKGANPDTVAPKVEQEEAIRAIADWSGVFLRAILHNDPDALEYITNLGYGEDDRVEVKGSF